jgi:hypothetical protein
LIFKSNAHVFSPERIIPALLQNHLGKMVCQNLQQNCYF